MTRSNLILALPSVIATAPVVPEVAQADAADAPKASRSPLTGSVKVEALAENASDALPDSASLAGAVSVSASPPSSGAIKGSKNKVHAVTPEEDYARALKSYQGGRYALAREQFAAFLQEFPGHSLAPNALYWSGETWYAQAHYDHAAKYFAQVVQDHPRHAKSPDALLKLGYSAMRQGLLDQAGVYLRQLETRYPDSPASKLGRQAQGRLQGQNSSNGAVLARG